MRKRKYIRLKAYVKNFLKIIYLVYYFLIKSNHNCYRTRIAGDFALQVAVGIQSGRGEGNLNRFSPYPFCINNF